MQSNIYIFSRFLRATAVGEVEETAIEEICEMSGEDFKRIREPIRPRSLKQLSGCRVRECLAENRTLPYGVWTLEIPMEIKNYLLLQEKPDQFYPEYVSKLCSRKRTVVDVVCCSKRQKTSVSLLCDKKD